MQSPATSDDARTFAADFERLTGNPPYRWQQRLYELFVAHELPTAIDLPTGLGKTSVMAIWLLARNAHPALPRRLVYVVDRRVVVDQATAEAEKLAANSADPLIVSTLRGRFVDNRRWLEDPSRPAIVVGTVDMIGSRLLFEGYGVSRRMRPYHAGLLGADTLVVLDEAHLCPPFQALVGAIACDDSLRPEGEARRAIVPPLHLLPLSATGGDAGHRPFQLAPEDWDVATQPRVHQRFTARKRLSLHPLDEGANLVDALATRAWALGQAGGRVIVFCDSHKNAKAVEKKLRGKAPSIEPIVGKRRVREREVLLERLREMGFVGAAADRDAPAFVVATSAGEVGIDIDADHMVADLVAFERMVQRLGRVNRAGGEGREATVEVICNRPLPPKSDAKDDAKTRAIRERIALFDAAKTALEALPSDAEGRRDASPQAIAALKQTQPHLVEAATTPKPLRPALDRAVVDAWSMTSLKEHTGRPEPEPWLRGWIDDDEPQTQVIWRRWLPWRKDDAPPIADEVEDFFDAARPHASEVLEAPAFEVVEVLLERAAKFGQPTLASSDGDSAGFGSGDESRVPSHWTEDGILILTPARELKGFRNVRDLKRLSEKAHARDKAELVRQLTNAIVVVSASLGGLGADGLLSGEAPEGAADIADATKLDEPAWPRGFRIELRRPGKQESDAEALWKEALNLPLGDSEEDDSPRLVVVVARGSGSAWAGDPAICRNSQRLDEHGAWAAAEAATLAKALGLDGPHTRMLVAAAREHDLGKKRALWQDAMRAPRDGGRPYAKTTSKGDPARLKIGEHTYRHEFGSLRDAEAAIRGLDVPEELRDLALHLIAAHHGFARPVIAPADPDAPPSASAARAREVALRFARLQRQWGPWGLAWWEALLRAADRQASRKLDEGAK